MNERDDSVLTGTTNALIQVFVVIAHRKSKYN